MNILVDADACPVIGITITTAKRFSVPCLLFCDTAHRFEDDYVKNALGHTAYLLSGISELSQLRKEHVRIETEDQVIEDSFLFGAICNSTSVGGVLTLDPKQVDMADGKFEVLMIRYPKDILEIPECIHALQTKKYNSPMITFMSTSSLKITADPNMSWTLDGEKGQGAQTIAIENLHHAIRLIKREKT